MEFDEVVKSYKKLDLVSKRKEIINNLIVQIKFLKKLCDEKKIKYKNIKCSLFNNNEMSEEESLVTIFIYVNYLNELNSKIIQNYVE